MVRWLRGLVPAVLAVTLVAAVAGCAGAPSGSRSPTPTASASPTARPTPTPAPTATPIPVAPPTVAPTVAPTSTAVPFPWPSGTPSVVAGEVRFALLVTGTPQPGETFQLYYQAPNAGQNEFSLCGGPAPCSATPGHVYQWGANGLPAGPGPYAFQRYINGAASTISSGTVDAANGALVTAITVN